MFSEIPKLSSTDYPRWSQTVKAYLGVQKALKVITKNKPSPTAEDANADAIEAWEELKGITQGVIILSLC